MIGEYSAWWLVKCNTTESGFATTAAADEPGYDSEGQWYCFVEWEGLIQGLSVGPELATLDFGWDAGSLFRSLNKQL